VCEPAATTASGGPATTSYSYSASFAVVLAARAIVAIGRVWADGKLLRDAGGQWLQPVTMRLHTGSERQAPDPLIAAAEGEATAFRGLAYAVFEDLPLAEFGNRLPNLSFELIADDAPVPLGAALAELAASAGVNLPVSGDFPEVAGLYLGAAAPLADSLAPSLKASGAVLAAGRALVGPGQPALAIAPGGSADARADGRQQAKERHRRNAAASSPDAIELGYYDVDRDYQPGLQRARLRAGVRVDGDGLPLALMSGRIDAIIAGMSPTEERKLSIDFTEPYYESDLVIVVLKNGPFAQAKTLADFAGAKITGQLNTFHYSVIFFIVNIPSNSF
jgi:ABC-type amino acid transport substrate-binding protein